MTKNWAVKRCLATLFTFLITAYSPAISGTEPLEKPDVAPWMTVLHDAGAAEQRGYSTGFSSGFPLVLGNDRVLMIYNDSASNRLMGTLSQDGGKTWGDAAALERNPDLKMKIGRPIAVKGKDGVLWIFYYGWVRYTKDPTTSESDLWVIHSSDDGNTWTGRRRIWSGYAGMLQGALETRAGTLVLPFCYLAEPSRFVNGVIVSRDHGQTWRFTPGVIDVPADVDEERRAMGLNGGALEPTITQLGDGRLWMLTRTVTGRLWESHSDDEGATWTSAQPTLLSCGGVIYLTHLSSGRLALIWNQADWSADWFWHFPWNFREISIALSDDDGKSWSHPLVFARGVAEVHSFLSEVSPGKLLITMPRDGLLLQGNEDSIWTAASWARFESPFIFRKYSSRPTAPQSWAQLYRYAHEKRNARAPANTRVVFMGDSITDFWRLENSFPAKDYVNRGISGQTTPQMLLRFYQDVIALNPSVVVILGGTNDIARDGGPNVPLVMTENSIAAMTELAQKHQIAVVLCSIPPVSDYSGTLRTDSRPSAAIHKLNDWIQRYASEVGVGFADYYSALVDANGMLRSEFSADGVHPNDAGYAAMKVAVQNAIDGSRHIPSNFSPHSKNIKNDVDQSLR